ncbi:hypothetical protein BD289DRAFT_484282 [Coniella lustricola]|uniref:GCN5-related N-acetyltransferase Rv2170-like domain-containing protein n=1 Tax=Coniella lustricola TaxID=2025994 RepID=A0A2T3A2J5_9PEZI|nr:hypothetical protein BD289DRAFT_484282 [Coniella lustricola]
MVIRVTDTQGPAPLPMLARLRDHLPHSYSLLRRGQFSHFGKQTAFKPQHGHFLLATDDDSEQNRSNGETQDHEPLSPAQSSPAKHFAAAYLDLSQHPSTEMFFYSTLQNHANPASALPQQELTHALDLAVAIFQRVRAIARATIADGRHPVGRPLAVMCGGLQQATHRLLIDRRGFVSSYYNPYDQWLFRIDALPVLPAELLALQTERCVKAGLHWADVRREDVPLIASRTKIPKVADLLMSEPSVGVRDGEGMLVAWAFMDIAGTLSTLHVEEPFRGQGIAKAIATTILREHTFGDDSWGSAEVHVDNVQSQGVCRSLGGKKGLQICWSAINYDSIPENEL